MPRLTRRAFLATGAVGMAAMLAAARAQDEAGRLRSRPDRPRRRATPGIHPLRSSGRPEGQGGWLYVPARYDPARAWPVALFFRGAITPSRRYLDAFAPALDAAGLVLVSPEPLGRTWDIVEGRLGPDAAMVDAALAEVFAQVRADPARLSMSGFSDGGSYALSLGLANGDAFQRIAAYAPGFTVGGTRRGKPRVAIIHGTRDQVLPFERTGQPIVESLRAAGYTVDLRTFDGPHAVHPEWAREAMTWMAGGPPVPERVPR